MTVKFLRGSGLSDDPILADFTDIELSYEGMRNDLKRLIELCQTGHMVSFEYECNQYNVMYDGSNGTVMIRDSVHEEHSIPEFFKRISMSEADFLEILQQHDIISGEQ